MEIGGVLQDYKFSYVVRPESSPLRIWQLGVLSGLLQTGEYARAILAVNPGVTEDQVGERLGARLARRAILTRDDPPAVWFLVDEAALRRCVGSPDIWTEVPGTCLERTFTQGLLGFLVRSDDKGNRSSGRNQELTRRSDPGRHQLALRG